MSKKPIAKVAVIGGGIIGISTALCCSERFPDVQITVIADKFTPYTTGDGSAGFWKPYSIGYIPPDLLRKWCEKTFRFLQDILKSPNANTCGVGLLSGYELSKDPVEKPIYSDVFFEWRYLTPKELEIFPSKYKYGTFINTIYAECTKLLPYLMKRFETNGGKYIRKKINSIEDLSAQYDIVINCPGVEAARLVPDSTVHPIRGQVIRVRAPWIKHAVSADSFYILPNSEEIICGGTRQEGDWNTELDPEDRERIWNGCLELIPSLKHAEIVREWVGLRPGRDRPRLEREKKVTKDGILEIIHNYGHGGSGVTLFWGCAEDAAKLLEEVLHSGQFRSRL